MFKNKVVEEVLQQFPILFNRSRLRYASSSCLTISTLSLLEGVAQTLHERMLFLTRSFKKILFFAPPFTPFHFFQNNPYILWTNCSSLSKPYQLICDEEWTPFAPNSFDAVICFFNLHWVNDLVGCLKQISYILKPDGLLMGCLFGGDTLKELKACFYEAELSLIHRTYHRFSPVLTPQDIGYLLQRTGFALPVVDRDLFKLRYQNLPELLKDLKKIQLRNNLVDIVPLKRSVLREVDSLYQKYYLFDNLLQATFDILYLNAWSPSPIQQKPLFPGSAKKLLTEVL